MPSRVQSISPAGGKNLGWQQQQQHNNSSSTLSVAQARNVAYTVQCIPGMQLSQLLMQGPRHEADVSDSSAATLRLTVASSVGLLPAGRAPIRIQFTRSSAHHYGGITCKAELNQPAAYWLMRAYLCGSCGSPLQVNSTTRCKDTASLVTYIIALILSPSPLYPGHAEYTRYFAPGWPRCFLCKAAYSAIHEGQAVGICMNGIGGGPVVLVESGACWLLRRLLPFEAPCKSSWSVGCVLLTDACLSPLLLPAVLVSL